MKNILIIVFCSLIIACNNQSTNQDKQIQGSSAIQNQIFIDSYKIEKAKYALTYFENEGLFLWGKFNIDDTITLLDFSRKKVIKTITKNYSVSEPGGLDQNVLTGLADRLKNGKSVLDCSIAILNNIEKINFIESEPISDSIVVNELDSICKSVNMVELYKDFDYYDSTIIDHKPIVEQVKVNNLDFYIVSFYLDDSKIIGPRFIVFPDRKFYSISGPCSTEACGIYSINEQLYIQSISICCGCGQVGYSLHKILNNTVELIYENGDFSM